MIKKIIKEIIIFLFLIKNEFYIVEKCLSYLYSYDIRIIRDIKND